MKSAVNDRIVTIMTAGVEMILAAVEMHRDRSRDRSQEDRGRYDRNRRDERDRESSGSGKRRT